MTKIAAGQMADNHTVASGLALKQRSGAGDLHIIRVAGKDKNSIHKETSLFFRSPAKPKPPVFIFIIKPGGLHWSVKSGIIFIKSDN
jgi:hypothetical protein